VAGWPVLIVAEVEQFPPEGQLGPLAAAREKSVAVPMSETDCGLPLALSAIAPCTISVSFTPRAAGN